MQRRGSGGRRNGSIYAPSEAVMPCSCSLFQDVDCGPGTFSIFFATSGAINEQPPEDDRDPYCGSYSSAVDCTLSLGTPSTRHQSHATAKTSPLSVIQNQQRANKTLPWDFMASQKKQTPAAASVGGATSVLRSGAGGGGLKLGGDHLLARRCANCDTTSTPLWRNGPRGPKSLCNACGIRYKKEERRAGSAVATLPSTSCSSSSAISAASHMEPPPAQHHQHLTGYDYYQNPWYYPAAALQATARKAASTPTFISAISAADDGNTMDGAAALPFLSWRLNMSAAPHAAEFVPGLVHDCT
ncbi:hypothetical protein Taro_030748 [Colocasia esculenta]|uniref:GATA-type domain-containing protein n=1 Tax=Colocasia esculenta TaxID=4460 RepID=A0A843VH31_COLES|nr:hypothetical protein [Colocasia esculenta]